MFDFFMGIDLSTTEHFLLGYPKINVYIEKLRTLETLSKAMLREISDSMV